MLIDNLQATQPTAPNVGGKEFVVDLSDTATLELITFASKLSKEMHPDIPAF